MNSFQGAFQKPVLLPKLQIFQRLLQVYKICMLTFDCNTLQNVTICPAMTKVLRQYRGRLN